MNLNDTEKAKLLAAIEEFDSLPQPKLSEPGDYCELSTEEPDIVVFRRANGQAFTWMSRAIYEQLRKEMLR